jgi:hypothetical protein
MGVCWQAVLSVLCVLTVVRRRAPLPDLIGNATVLDTYVNDDLTAITCEFTLEIVPLSTTLRILDRFTVNDDGKITEQSNYFDPRNVANPGWQHASC